VVVACERRCGVLEPILEHENLRAQVIRLRCTGQIDAGMLLELRRHGARRIIVAGCESQRCRYGSGATLAAQQVDRANAVHDLLGGAEPFVVCDWSGNRLDDPLEELLKRHTLTIRGPKPAGS
jgi:coenzyme F420-reducing hydrogenase delta subunit